MMNDSAPTHERRKLVKIYKNVLLKHVGKSYSKMVLDAAHKNTKIKNLS